MNLSVQGLTKSYGALTVMKDFSLDFPGSKITCLLGPSGAGKSTLLNILSGLVKPDAGKVMGVNNQSISYLFQEPRLLPRKTVWENFEFVLRAPYPDQDKRGAIIAEFLTLVGLKDFADYYPAELSGGMKQRASIARAFAYPSNILLMDEPFKALDMQLKHSLMNEFLKLWHKDKRTVICVTHDLEEALYLGDHIYLVSSLPTKVITQYNIPIPRGLRKQHDPHLAEMRAELLTLLLGSS